MSISITELTADAREELGAQFAVEAHSDANMKAYENKAIRKIDKEGDWSFRVEVPHTFTANGSGSPYTIPFQKQTLALKLNGTSYPYCKLEEYFSADDNSKMVAIQGDKLYTSLSGNFSIVYRGMTPRITSIASGNIDFPEYLYEAMLYATLYYGFMKVKDFERMREQAALLKDEMERVKRTFGNLQPNNMARLGSGSRYVW